ncbi:MAG: hypothetical protein KF830_02300 [Planctomycetes bacterium]|nr:hypothetical protein [Planctomycetota bacterium]
MVATERVADAAAVEADAAVAIGGQEAARERVRFPLATQWTPADCTVVELGGLPVPCEVIVQTPHLPGLLAGDGLRSYRPVDSGNGLHRFLVPADEYQLVPAWGIAPQHAYRQDVRVEPGRLLEVAPLWGLGVLEIRSEGPRGSFAAVAARGRGGMMKFAPEQLPALVDVAPGEYLVHVLDDAGQQVSEQVVRVDSSERVVVVVP